MANGYPPSPRAGGDQMPPDTPETPQDQPDDPNAPNTPDTGPGAPAKQSQADANYREGNPQRSCGLCGSFDSKDHGCDTVEGEISPYGFCNYYVRQDNPFRQGTQEGFIGRKISMVGGMPVAAQPVATVQPGQGPPPGPPAGLNAGPPPGPPVGPPPGPPRLRIGSKTY